MNNVFYGLGSFILAFIFKTIGLWYLYIQFLLVGIWRGFIGVLPLIRGDLLATGYPLEKCTYVKKSILVTKDSVNKRYPQELICASKFYWGGFLVFSFLLWAAGMCFRDALELFYAGYVLFCFLVDLILIRKAYRMAFYEKFKRLTIHNLSKYILGCSRLKKSPEKVKMGACIILEERAKFRKVYYTVKIKKTGNVYDKVIYCGEGQCEKNRVHTLYEIYGVRYIV